MSSISSNVGSINITNKPIKFTKITKEDVLRTNDTKQVQNKQKASTQVKFSVKTGFHAPKGTTYSVSSKIAQSQTTKRKEAVTGKQFKKQPNVFVSPNCPAVVPTVVSDVTETVQPTVVDEPVIVPAIDETEVEVFGVTANITEPADTIETTVVIEPTEEPAVETEEPTIIDNDKLTPELVSVNNVTVTKKDEVKVVEVKEAVEETKEVKAEEPKKTVKKTTPAKKEVKEVETKKETKPVKKTVKRTTVKKEQLPIKEVVEEPVEKTKSTTKKKTVRK